MRGHKRHNQHAFTLPELMIAAIILAFTFVGLLMTFLKCMDLNEMARNKMIAIEAVKNRIEEIKNEPFNTINSMYHNVGFAAAGLTGFGNSTVTTVNASLLEIQVSFYWQQRNGLIIGEAQDSNADGVIDQLVDTNGNGVFDSPTRVTTYIYDR